MRKLLVLFISIFIIGCSSNNAQHKTFNPIQNIDFRVNSDVVAVLDYGLIETLGILNVTMHGIPKDDLPQAIINHLQSSAVNLGRSQDINIEALRELNPDFILISNEQLPIKEQLEEIGKVLDFSLDKDRFIESFFDNTTSLGILFNRETQVSNLIFPIKENVRLVRESNVTNRFTTAIIDASSESIKISTNEMLNNLVYDTFDYHRFSNLDVSTLSRYQPDFVFIIDHDRSMDRDLYYNIEAYLNGRTFYLNPEVFNFNVVSVNSVREMVDSFRR